jgi:uncharacterized phage infection (PIP) family protein YhgE
MSQGRITVDLLAKTGSFETDINRSAKLAAKRAKEIDRAFYSAGRAVGASMRTMVGGLLAATGVTLTVGAAFEGLKKAIDLADETRDLSIRLGASTETISAFRYAAQQTGTDMDSLAKGMKILAKNAADAINPTSAQAKVFDALGIKVTDSAGRLKDLSDLIPEIADKFKGLEDGTTKAALAQALFGKSGLELTEFLNQGADGLKAYTDKARELGIVIDSQTAAAADDFKDTLGDLKAEMGGVALQVARELLPTLKDLVSDLRDLIHDGNLAADVATVLGTAFHAGVGLIKEYENAVNRVSLAIEGLVEISAGMDEVQRNLRSLGLAEGSVAEGYERINNAIKNGQKALDSLSAPKPVSVQFITPDSGNLPESAFKRPAATHQTVDSSRIAKALSNPSTKSSGKSDAEKQAEQVARAIEQMTKAQQDWEAELSKTGNPIADEYADRLRQIAEQAKQFAKDGVPADKVKAFTASMTELADKLRDKDLAQAQKEFSDETAEMAAQLKGPASEALLHFQQEEAKLKQELADGTITLDQYIERMKILTKLRDAPVSSVLQDIQEQYDMLGLTIEEQDTYNRLRQVGSEISEKDRQSIIAATHALHEHAKAVSDQTEAMDALRDATAGFFEDLAHGVGVWDALKKAADNFAAAITQIIAQRLVERLFGQMGSANGGSSGNWIGSLFGSLFGGGRADGGDVLGGTGYLVGEQGPELFVPRTAGVVIPAHITKAMGGGGNVVNNAFYLPERYSPQTQSQISQKTGIATRRALTRN